MLFCQGVVPILQLFLALSEMIVFNLMPMFEGWYTTVHFRLYLVHLSCLFLSFSLCSCSSFRIVFQILRPFYTILQLSFYGKRCRIFWRSRHFSDCQNKKQNPNRETLFDSGVSSRRMFLSCVWLTVSRLLQCRAQYKSFCRRFSNFSSLVLLWKHLNLLFWSIFAYWLYVFASLIILFI